MFRCKSYSLAFLPTDICPSCVNVEEMLCLLQLRRFKDNSELRIEFVFPYLLFVLSNTFTQWHTLSLQVLVRILQGWWSPLKLWYLNLHQNLYIHFLNLAIYCKISEIIQNKIKKMHAIYTPIWTRPILFSKWASGSANLTLFSFMDK